jgi:VWFA-related protein
MVKILGAALAAAWFAASPQFTSRVEVIRIDALVTSGGKPVVGLTARDFEVRDDGVLQQVRLVDAGLSQLDVILALDMSASLTAERLAQLQAAGEALLQQLRPEDRAAVITFDQAIIRRQPLTSDVARLRDALRGGTRGGRTSLVDAMFAGISLAEGGDRRTLVLVFTDGLDTSSWLEPDTIVEVARRSSVVVYGVSTSSPATTSDTLRQVAKATGGEVIDGSSTTLQTAFTDVLNEFRQRYLLIFSPAAASAPGWHRLDVRMKRRGATVKTRAGYFVASRD